MDNDQTFKRLGHLNLVIVIYRFGDPIGIWVLLFGA